MKESNIRVIAGAAKGARLYCVEGNRIRPALARVKKSIFDILRLHVPQAEAADLFAGTGSIGIEALSRGAKNCLFMENDPQCAGVIRKNLNKLRLEDVSTVYEADAFSFPATAVRNDRHFDLIFINPPYRYFDEQHRRELFFDMLKGISANNILNTGGFVIIEHGRGQFDNAEFSGMQLSDLRNYDDTQVSFLRIKGLI